MKQPSELTLRPFARADQTAVRQLVLAGLREHFGELDPTRNEDLKDIWASYTSRGHTFLVAERNGCLVGVGALVREARQGQIVRVSVVGAYRRQGIARAIVDALLVEARAYGLNSVWMETNDDWLDAIALYLSAGFRPFDRHDGCIFMRAELHAQP